MDINVKAKQLQQLANMAAQISDEIIEAIGSDNHPVQCMAEAIMAITVAKMHLLNLPEMKRVSEEINQWKTANERARNKTA